MTLAPFDRDLLKMMHELTKHPRLLSSLEISHHLSKAGMPVTDRTVRRWFVYLRRHGFWYFAQTRHDVLGLDLYWVMSAAPDLNGIPNKIAIVQGVSLDRTAKYIATLHAIPAEHSRDFVGLCRKQGLESIPIRSQVVSYSPWHEGIDRHGHITPIPCTDVEAHVARLKRELTRPPRSAP